MEEKQSEYVARILHVPHPPKRLLLSGLLKPPSRQKGLDDPPLVVALYALGNHANDARARTIA
jgi:hypothetical protein